MEEENIEQTGSSRTVSLSSLESLQSLIEPKLMDGIIEGNHDNNLQTPNASSEVSIQQEHLLSLVLSDNKSKLLEISVEQSVPIDGSVTLSLEVDRSGLPSTTNEVSDDFQSSSTEAFKSKEAQDDSMTLQSSVVIPTADCEASMQQECSMSLVPTVNKSSSQEISVEEKVPICGSITLSSKVENAELPSTNQVPDCFPSSMSEANESIGTQDDSVAMESSEVTVVSQYLLRSREGVQVDSPCTYSDNVGCDISPTILKKVKEDKNQFVHRLQKRQMSLTGTRQKMPAPVIRSFSVKNLRMDNTTVDTTTHIESVKVAASKFGGSINWKTHRAQQAQGSGHTVLELDKLKNKISECKRQAEAVEASTMSVFDDLERTNKLADELKRVLERKQAEEVDAKEDFEFFQFMVQEIEDGVVSGDSCMIEEKLKIIQERNKEVLNKLKLMNDESKKLQEDYDTLLIERDISIRKAQAACALFKESERQVEDLTHEIKRLHELLDLDRATLHDAEESKKEASILQEIDCSIWEVNLRQAEEELKKCEKLSSIEELKSEFDASLNLLLNLKNELTTFTGANPTEEALEEEDGTYKSMEEVIAPSNELKNYSKSIAKITNELYALKITAATLKSELNKEQAALSAMQQRETVASMTVQTLKMEIKHSLQELEAARTKVECQDGMVELPSVLQYAAWEADKAKSISNKAQEELRKTQEEIEQTKASLSTMECKLQAVLREIETAKKSERLALSAIRALEIKKTAINIEQQGSPRLITVDLDDYNSLIERAHRAEVLVHERTAAAIALVEAARASESQTLSRLDETFKALLERKQAFLDATEHAERATEGKLATEQELRKWREEGRQRRRASEASKSETRPSKAADIVVDRSADAKCASKEDSYALVHPLSDASGRSSPNDLVVLHAKAKKARKLSFFPRIFKLLSRRRRKALK